MGDGKIIERDRGWEAIKKRIPTLAGKLLKVGVLESAGMHKTASIGGKVLSMAELATVHEYGLGVPQRSFIRSTVTEQEQAIRATLRKVGDRVLMGKMTAEQGLRVLGEDIKSKIQRKITTGPFVPNAPSTIARKGSSRPLIDTGSLRASISYEIVDAKGQTIPPSEVPK